MSRHLMIMAIFMGLAGCTSNTSPPPIPQFTLQSKQKTSDGYYQYSTYAFKGQLKDGIPHGLGQCRTLYLTELGKSEWLNGACEFSHGIRIDHLHKKRQEHSLALVHTERQNELRLENERKAREIQQRREAAAERQANQQMWANTTLHGLNTLNASLQQAENDRIRFNAQVTQTINNAQQQRQHMEQINQTNSTSSSSFSSQQSVSIDKLKEGVKKDEQELLKKQEQQRKQEMEQKQQALTKKREEEKRQKELERKKQEDLRLAAEAQKKQELLDYNRAIRAGTRVGAISCHGGQSTRIVGVLGKAQRPKHVYNNCQLREVRYRCPSESNWQNYVNNDWLLNNACMGGIGDDVTVNVNCPAEQLIVQATRFSCDVK